MEEWREVEGYPGYMISNLGNARGPRKEYLKLVDGGQGYTKITLSKNGKHVDKRINRLVAQAFIPNPENLPVVMHKDNDRANNRVDNLAWGTHSENNIFGEFLTATEERPEDISLSIFRSGVIANE